MVQLFVGFFGKYVVTNAVIQIKLRRSCHTNGDKGSFGAGFFAGAVLAAIVVILQTILDVRIKTEEDLKRICDAPVLGVIPVFNIQTEEAYGYTANVSQKQGGKAVKK